MARTEDEQVVVISLDAEWCMSLVGLIFPKNILFYYYNYNNIVHGEYRRYTSYVAPFPDDEILSTAQLSILSVVHIVLLSSSRFLLAGLQSFPMI